MNKNGEKEGKRSKGQKKDINKSTKVNNPKGGDNKVPAEEKCGEADDASKKFPNFNLLSAEERLLFYQALSTARKNVEKTGAPTRERFGTVHDEYLKFFNQEDKKEEEGSTDEASASVASHVTVAEGGVSPSQGGSVEEVCGRESSKEAKSQSPTLLLEGSSEAVVQQPEPKSELLLRRLSDECEAVIQQDTDKVMDMYLDKKKRNDGKSGGRKSSQGGERKASKLPKAEKKQRQQQQKESTVAYQVSNAPAKMKETPRFDALTAEEKEMFFNILQEARDNIVVKNPDKKEEILPLQAIVKRYAGQRPASSVYAARVQGPSRRCEGKKNVKVKVTLTSGDNERLQKAKSEEFRAEEKKEEKDKPADVPSERPPSEDIYVDHICEKEADAEDLVEKDEHNKPKGKPSNTSESEKVGVSSLTIDIKSSPSLKNVRSAGEKMLPTEAKPSEANKIEDGNVKDSSKKQSYYMKATATAKEPPKSCLNGGSTKPGEPQAGETPSEDEVTKKSKKLQEEMDEQMQEPLHEGSIEQRPNTEEPKKECMKQEQKEEEKEREEKEREEKQREEKQREEKQREEKEGEEKQREEKQREEKQREEKQREEKQREEKEGEEKEREEKDREEEKREEEEREEEKREEEEREEEEREEEEESCSPCMERPESQAEACRIPTEEEMGEECCTGTCNVQVSSVIVSRDSWEISEEAQEEEEEQAEAKAEGSCFPGDQGRASSRHNRSLMTVKSLSPGGGGEGRGEECSSGEIEERVKEAKEEEQEEEEEEEGVKEEEEEEEKMKEFSGMPNSPKVMIVDDNVIEKIRKLICYLEAKAGKDDRLEKEYMKLLVDYVDYLSKVLEALVHKKERRKQVQRAYPAEVSLKFHEDSEREKGIDKGSKFMPRSVSAQDFMYEGFPGAKKNLSEEKTKAKNHPETLSTSMSLSDSGSSLNSEQETPDMPPPSTTKKVVATKIRLLQDLLKQRAEFVQGSIDDMKIIQYPPEEYVPQERAQSVKLITEDTKEHAKDSHRLKLLRALIKCFTCGKKKREDEGIFDNLRGEAVRVDVSDRHMKDPANATLNLSTVEVLNAAGRKRIIDKYYGTT